MNFILGGREMLKLQRKRKGIGLIELGLYCIALAIIVAAAAFAYTDFQEGSKRSLAKQEVKLLAEACALYTVSIKTSTPPDDLGKLYGTTASPAIAAANSNDGFAKVSFVTKSGWNATASSYVDPWGAQYIYDKTARTVSCKMNGNTTYTVSF